MQTFNTVKEVFSTLGAVGAVEWLDKNLGITAAPFENGDLYMVNYSQIDSPKTHPIVIECRSLIVDKIGNTVSSKFDRFFNVGEAPEITGQIDIANSTIFNKEDGSLIGVWFNPISNRWDISTRKMPQALGEFEMPNGDKTTFREMVLSTFGVDEDGFQVGMQKIHAGGVGSDHCTYVFEWCHPLNRIVTPYDKPCAYLLTVVGTDRDDYPISEVRTISHLFAATFDNVEMVESFDASGMTIKEIEDVVSGLTDLKEGFVIQCNRTMIRAKIKSKTYLTAHRLRGEFKIPRDKDLCELVQINEQDEFLAYFPEWEPRVSRIQMVVGAYVDALKNKAVTIPFDGDMKQYAAIVNSDSAVGSLGKSYLFMNRRKGTQAEGFIKDMSVNKFYDFYNEALMAA